MANPDSENELNKDLHYYKKSSINSLHGPAALHYKKVQDHSSFQTNLSHYGYNKICNELLPDIHHAFKKQEDYAIVSTTTSPAKTDGTTISIAIHQDKDVAIVTNSTTTKYNNNNFERDVEPIKANYISEPLLPKNNSKCHDESEDFLVPPPPFPPKPSPAMAKSDDGDSNPELGRCETVLDNKIITCFDIGGEKRLCFPQILSTILHNINITVIQSACDKLNINYNCCTPKQLDMLKTYGDLPSNTFKSGLITLSDASRLIHFLLHKLNAYRDTAITQKILNSLLKVSHNCFGKCKGAVRTDLYVVPNAPCIVCLECEALFSPENFVRHAHRHLERKTVHWGFDSNNWRYYLLLSKDQPMDIHKAELELDNFKNKFDMNCHANNKRKQAIENKDDIKKIRSEDLQNPQQYYPHPHEEQSQSYRWNYPFVTNRDGKRVGIPPPSGFIRESVSTLPANLNKEPPVLVNPAVVVPLSESEKFERHYQPNVALAPPKVRDKLAREAAAANRTKVSSYSACVSSAAHNKQKSIHRRDSVEDVVVVKLEQEESPSVVVLDQSESGGVHTSPCKSESLLARGDVTLRHCDNTQAVSNKLFDAPETYSCHPDLELSTTDSDTESAVSISSKNELVDEGKMLLTTWVADRAAAERVSRILEELANLSEDSEMRKEFKMNTRNKSPTLVKVKTEPLENGNC